MKPQNLKTHIFLDSGDPDDTKKMLDMMGFLDGQTTNPSLIAKKLSQGYLKPVIPAPAFQRGRKAGIYKIPDQAGDDNAVVTKLTEDELLSEYKTIVQEISSLIPDGSVSIEVYADESTSANEMLKQGKEMSSWIPNAHIKFPTNPEGLKAAEMAIHEGIRVNMTLVFTQEQAAAVYSASKGVGRGEVFVSPFIGRLDDKGLNGMDVIKHISTMYLDGDKHVMNLAASIRSLDHFMGSIASGADIITSPMSVLEQWIKSGMIVPDDSYSYNAKDLKSIEYKKIDLEKDWHSFDIKHKLTEKGLAKFAEDWKSLIT